MTLDEQRSATSSPNSKGDGRRRDQLRQARRLFARAVETPGGLKIETIHAFCERLLHLVPFEANVPARFSVLDESQAASMLAQATDRTCWRRPRAEASPELADALDRSASMPPASG